MNCIDGESTHFTTPPIFYGVPRTTCISARSRFRPYSLFLNPCSCVVVAHIFPGTGSAIKEDTVLRAVCARNLTARPASCLSGMQCYLLPAVLDHPTPAMGSVLSTSVGYLKHEVARPMYANARYIMNTPFRPSGQQRRNVAATHTILLTSTCFFPGCLLAI